MNAKLLSLDSLIRLSALAALLSLGPVPQGYGQSVDDLNPGADANVYIAAMQPDGKILIGGDFTTLCGQPHKFLGRLNPDGTLDTTFNPGPNYRVACLAVQADGKILVGGDFTTLGGQPHSKIGRLNGDGTVDTNFNAGAS